VPTLFSGIALFLAVVGIYGLLAYSVRQRTGEIGLRMALGSTRTGIVRLVLREGLSLLITGLCLAWAAAVAFSRLLRSLLYEVPVLDPLTFALVEVRLVAAHRTIVLSLGSASHYPKTSASRGKRPLFIIPATGISGNFDRLPKSFRKGSFLRPPSVCPNAP
jgi:ABC-type antimicrobial peptide transport system permease subunit